MFFLSIIWSVYNRQLNWQCVSFFRNFDRPSLLIANTVIKLVMSQFSFTINHVLLMGIAIVKCWSISLIMLWFTNFLFVSSIATMSHDYNTRTVANLEKKLLDRFSSFKNEVINLKDVIIRNLQEEKCKVKEQRQGSWKQIEPLRTVWYTKQH